MQDIQKLLQLALMELKKVFVGNAQLSVVPVRVGPFEKHSAHDHLLDGIGEEFQLNQGPRRGMECLLHQLKLRERLLPSNFLSVLVGVVPFEVEGILFQRSLCFGLLVGLRVLLERVAVVRISCVFVPVPHADPAELKPTPARHMHAASVLLHGVFALGAHLRVHKDPRDVVGLALVFLFPLQREIAGHGQMRFIRAEGAGLEPAVALHGGQNDGLNGPMHLERQIAVRSRTPLILVRIPLFHERPHLKVVELLHTLLTQKLVPETVPHHAAATGFRTSLLQS
mmetsp:Transcript_54496/g.106606  ORF Transcript_54496/g.106606 Transcript_54496/m.106606 type:complete len:283 (-) Transcript_54496:273-1121(-)